jgi:hypothetical protein
MRNYKTIIQEAELLAMPPVAVADLLKTRATQTKAEAREDVINEDVERALRGRADPLIDISLARYGRNMKVVSELFHSASSTNAIRLACLTNKCLVRGIGQQFPETLLNGKAKAVPEWAAEESDEEPCLSDETKVMAEWISDASDEELCALFENPNLSDSFLRDVLERGEGWEAITDDKLCDIVCVLQSNPRMRMAREDDYMDGFADYSYSSVFNAAWQLAETAPTTKYWARDLGGLYEHLQPDAFSIKDKLKLAERWHIDPSDAEANESQAEDHEMGYLSDMERVRKGLGRLALQTDYQLLSKLLESDDLAFRVAAYAAGTLDAEQLQAGYEKDGGIFFNEAIHNLRLWQRHDTRQSLQQIAWEVVKSDKRSDLMAANVYRGIEKRIREKHPTWFADERNKQADDKDVTQPPATKDDLAPLTEHLNRHAESIEALREKLDDLILRTEINEAQSLITDRESSDIVNSRKIQDQAVETMQQALHAIKSHNQYIDDQSRAIKGDILSLSKYLDCQTKSTEAIEKSLQTLLNKTKWIWWFLLGALVASLRNF